jgi:hypothetical protein
MTPQLREYYEAQFDMMASKGWKDMCEDLTATLVALKDVTTATPETLLNRQGRIAELSFILNRPATFSHAFEELSADAS